MILLTPMLKVMRMSQPFGVDWVSTKLEPDFYKKIGIPSGKHNGWDLKCPEGTPIYAPCHGTLETRETPTAGKTSILKVVDDGEMLEIRFLHLSENSKTGQVKRGEQIGLTGATGSGAKGPHLHFDIRVWTFGNGIWVIKNPSNGYDGLVDPTPFFSYGIWYQVGDEFKLPVDTCYGMENKPPTMGWQDWAKASADFYLHSSRRKYPFKSRLFTDREAKALRWGCWDLETVMEDSLRPIWQEYSKPEAQNKGIIR